MHAAHTDCVDILIFSVCPDTLAPVVLKELLIVNRFSFFVNIGIIIGNILAKASVPEHIQLCVGVLGYPLCLEVKKLAHIVAEQHFAVGAAHSYTVFVGVLRV